MNLLGSLLLSLSLAAAQSGAQAPSKSNLVIAPCESGVHYQFERSTCAIELKNVGPTPIHISRGEAKFPWDSIETKEITVPAHAVAYVNATVDWRNSSGQTQRAFRFATDESGQKFRGSDVRGFIESVLEDPQPKIDFGVVKPENDLPEKSITLASRAIAEFKILGIESKPDWLEASVDKDARTVHMKLRKDVPWGLIPDGQFVKFKINTPQQAQAWVKIAGNVLGDVAPDGNPFQLGLLRTNQNHEFLLRLTSRSGTPFSLGKIQVNGIKATTSPQPCLPVSKSCRLVKLVISREQPVGRLQGTLEVELPDRKKTLPIEFVGLLLSPEAKVHNLDEMMQEHADGAKSSAAKPAQQIGAEIANSIKRATPPAPGNGPLLRWAVQHEDPIFGYVIYRADAESGSFVRINTDIVRASAEGADKSGAYQWRDNTARSGKTYWYQIGIVNRDGSKKDLTGAQRVVAK